MRLRSFEDEHIRGLRYLLDLLLSSRAEPARLVFCSSVASVLGRRSTDNARRETVIPETISTTPQDASELGYSRSKWVAEAICSKAHEKTRLKGRVDVVRIGQLCGDTKHGVWNASEAWPIMLSSVAATGCLPDLEDEKLGWLAVDLAAKAVIEIGLRERDATGSSEASKCAVHHIFNPDRSVKWADMLDWIRGLRSEPFQVVEVRGWVTKLEGLDGKNAAHPAKKLLGLWKDACCKEPKGTTDSLENRLDEEGKQLEPLQLAMQRTILATPIMQEVGPVSKEHFGKIWEWIEDEMIDSKIDGDTRTPAT